MRKRCTGLLPAVFPFGLPVQQLTYKRDASTSEERPVFLGVFSFQ